MNKDKLNAFAYKLGYIFATIVVLCLLSVVVALTIKFLFWLF